MIYAKELREKLARLSNDMHAIVDKAKAENARGLTSEERERFHNLESEYSAIEESIELSEKADKYKADLSIVPKDKLSAALDVDPKAQQAKDTDLHNRAFGKYLRGGLGHLNAEEQQFLNAAYLPNTGIRNTPQSTTTGSQGGYLVPTGFSGQLDEALKFFGGILGNVDEFETETGNPLPWPTVNDTGNTGYIVGQNAQLTQTYFTFGQVTFNAYIFASGAVPVPLALLQDSYFDLDTFIARSLGTRIGRYANNQLTVGTGGGVAPEGLVTAVVAAGNGNVGATGQTTSIIYNDLVNLEHAVDPAYRPKGKFMFHDYTLKVLKKLTDSANRPLWQPALTASFGQGAQPMILDHPYVINNDMPVMAANATPMIFGDLSKYKVRKVAGGTTIMRLMERYADYLQVGFQAFMRMDGQLIDAGTHPIAYYQNSAT